jgi:hypothetical protein
MALIHRVIFFLRKKLFPGIMVSVNINKRGCHNAGKSGACLDNTLTKQAYAAYTDIKLVKSQYVQDQFTAF